MGNLIRRDNRAVARPAGREWDPFRMMDALLRWEPFRSDGGWLSDAVEFAPRFDVKETRDAYVVKADMPGMSEKHVDVTVTGNVLTISGEREEEQREEGDRFFTMERSYGRFSRSLALPDGTDGDNVKADLKDGVLTVQIPKRPEVQPKRISIGKGAAGSEGTAKA